MAVQKIQTDQFLQLATESVILDVRSPAEYAHAHIPGAYSFPLFTDEERKIVGTTYKQQSREDAIKTGLIYFGPKMRAMIEEIEKTFPQKKTFLVHCWRGGMRSAGVAWLLDLYGFKVYTLSGGYKKYRDQVLQTFNTPSKLYIIGGYTGSGKTEVLKALSKKGESILDLEALASHKGSAFGALGMPAQPSQEMFENLLAGAIHHLPAHASVWVEDESQRIGEVNIPNAFWQKMRNAEIAFLNIPFEHRLDHIVNWYGKQDREKMVNAILRIKKRLGGLETKNAIGFLIEDNVKECFRILLRYYDKYYLRSLHTRENLESCMTSLVSETTKEEENASLILKKLKKKEITTHE
ncbi:MAG: tRNA 2-selenouridine(34) synthase MnmH [Gemmatimonadaceae bacterium]|nr:tRNA 2-selenouridine(34) synthase MnmH [Chitinophagaceae bacterium]